MDNKKFIGWQDRIQVDLNDHSEVEYFHSKHSLFSHQEIKDAIKIAGPFRQKVHDYLNERMKFKAFQHRAAGLFGGMGMSSLFNFVPQKKVETKK